MKKIGTFLFGLLLALQTQAQGSNVFAGEFAPRTFSERGNNLNYQVLYPENFDEGKKYPLLLFLHGAGERGDDNQKQLVHGSNLFLETQKDYPAIVLFPQCPTADYWGDVDVDRSGQQLRFDFQNDATPT
ncbi:MAG: hypothetical protein KDD15_25965, partial [Lewinella sp.]|nr:hypothetical protein [Lewinella sp.]